MRHVDGRSRSLVNTAGYNRDVVAHNVSRTADLVLAHLPLPVRGELTDEQFAGVRRLRMARRLAGRRMRDVSCWLVGDTVIDTGLGLLGPRVVELARLAGVRRAILTHHHEDHAGCAHALAMAGVEVHASDATAKLVARRLPIRPYQHVVWGAARPVVARTLGRETAVGPHRSLVLPAPGHAIDQVVLWIPERGWLFSGDVFIAEHVKAFRRDEDFAATVVTLESLARLDVGVLFCAHRPQISGGREALRRKAEWLRELEGLVHELVGRGAPEREIVRRLRLPGTRGLAAATLGDVSTGNMVRSILGGPTPRREVIAALG